MIRLRSLAAFLVLAALAAPSAHADGDPASHVLLGSDVFLPFTGSVPEASASELRSLLRDARAKRAPIKVALISGRGDLGSVPDFYGKPQAYAKLLGREIDYLYRGLLLVVMPQGYGVYRAGKPTAAKERTLVGLATPRATGHDLATAAVPAVRRLAAPLRLTAAPLAAEKKAGGGGQSRLVLAAVGGGIVVLATFLLVGLGARRRRN